MAEVFHESLEPSKKMFGPLSFEDDNSSNCSSNVEQECLLCDKKYKLKKEIQPFLKHIFEEHNLIIEGFQDIDQIDKYVNYWKEKFKTSKMESVVPSVKIDNTNQCYYILSDLLKEDKKLRHSFKLESAILQQEYERNAANFKKTCLFCKFDFEGKVSDFINHLSFQHNLQLGKPENLVYTAELVNIIEQKINSLKCIFCEKTFTDRSVLKEHMRKKLHKRINPRNYFYDKFFIINYLETDRTWQHLDKEDDNLPMSLEETSDQEWADWCENNQEFVCLFCDYKDSLLNNTCDHMKYGHKFDFQNVLRDLEYYQKVKLVNFIRRQIHLKCCILCNVHFETKDALLDHMKEENHFFIPNHQIFDQPEYYFPTYEDDTLLYYLEEIDDLN